MDRKTSLFLVATALWRSSEAFVGPMQQQQQQQLQRNQQLEQQQQQRRRPLSSSASPNDAAFSAFAESLQEDAGSTASSRARSRATLSTNKKATATVGESPKVLKTWQAKLDDLLNPASSMAQRQILLSELLSSNDEIRQSVMDALSNWKIDPLLTPNQKKLQEGTRAVARQIANDILPNLKLPQPQSGRFPAPESVGKAGTKLFNIISNQLQKNIDLLQEDLADPLNKIPQRLSRQRDGFVQEARNVFLETPEGLQEPPYTVVESTSDYEIRDYEGYTVAATVMPTRTAATTAQDLTTAGNAFNTLAAYLFGDNEDNRAMAMTTPVTTTSMGEMRFYLAEAVVPQPRDMAKTPVVENSENTARGAVQIVEIPPARLAVRKFTGFVTDGEIARQKDTLLQSLECDGVELDVAHGAVVPHVIFQYNPPYTLPMVRRNEIAVPVCGTNDELDRYNAIWGSSMLREESSVDSDATEVAYVNDRTVGHILSTTVNGIKTDEAPLPSATSAATTKSQADDVSPRDL